MGKSQRKEKAIALRRDEIIDAAERLFSSESFEAVTMDRIASEAEFTKQTLYSYFKGKEEILAAVYVRAAKSINTAFEMKLSIMGSASGYDMLDAMRGIFMEIAESKPLYIRMMAVFGMKDLGELTNLGIYEEIMAENMRLGKAMAECIDRGTADGSIPGDIVPESGIMFMNALITGAVCITVFNEQYIRSELKTEPLYPLKGILEFSMRAFRRN